MTTPHDGTAPPRLMQCAVAGATQPFTAVYANNAVAIGYGAVARTPNEVAIRAFGRTIRFHHHGGVGWRTFRRFLFTPTGTKVIRLLFSRAAAPGSTAATPTDHGPA